MRRTTAIRPPPPPAVNPARHARFRMPSAAEVAMMGDAELDAAFDDEATGPVQTRMPGDSDIFKQHRSMAQQGTRLAPTPKAPARLDPGELIGRLMVADPEAIASAAKKLKVILRQERSAGGAEVAARVACWMVASSAVPPLVGLLSRHALSGASAKDRKSVV